MSAARRIVTVLATGAASFGGFIGTAAAAEPDLSVPLPVDQQLLHVENTSQGAQIGSPGLLSGNVVQVPQNLPANVCGNTVDVIGVLNPTFGNGCVNK